MRIFTGVIAAATVAQAYIYWHQKKLMRNTLLETAKAAGAAKKGADVAEMALKLAERADVLLKEASISTPTGMLGKESQVILEFKNYGRTRAENVLVNMTLHLSTLTGSPTRTVGPLIMGAGEVQTISFKRLGDFLDEDGFGQIMRGEATLRFTGTISYTDAFKEPHTTSPTGILNRNNLRFTVAGYSAD